MIDIIPIVVNAKRIMIVIFKEDNDLSEREKKYCSCLLKVGSKGSAYNKYAVCNKSTGGQNRRCRQNYDMDRMPDEYNQEILKKDRR